MIVSHKHKFIFIKTEKTAGTSIEIALSSICGVDDIITPISPNDEKYRIELGFRSKQNFQIPLKDYRKKRDIARVLYRRKRLEFYNHMAAIDVRKFLDKEVWDTYFKFTFERNPFDKLISWYYWCNRNNQYTSITDFINSGRAGKVKGFELYTDGANLIIDKIYKFEDINNAMLDISEQLKLDEPISLPTKKTKGSTRKLKSHYSEILTDDEKDWAKVAFARELALLDYEY